MVYNFTIMKKIHIRKALGVGWESYKRRPWYLLGLTIAVTVLFAVSIGNMVATALSSIVYAGYLIILIKHYRGEAFVFDDLFMSDKRWIYFAFLAIIKGILILIGLICFIVPGVYLAVRWIFAEYLVIDQGMRPLEALRESSRLTEGHRWHLFLYSVVAVLLLLLGLLCLLVGFFVAMTVLLVATFVLYEEVKTHKTI